MSTEKQLEDSYENLKFSLAAVLVNAAAFFLIFYGHADNQILIIWFAAVFIVTISRYILFLCYKRSRTALDTNNWYYLFTLGVVFSAVIWGSVPILFFKNEDYIYQMIIIIIMAGLSAGALSSLSQILINIRLFLFIMISPLIYELFIQENIIYDYIGILVILFLLLLQKITKQFNENYIDSVNSLILYRKKKSELLQSEQKFEAIFQNVPIGSFIYNKDLVIEETNQDFLDFIGAPRNYILGLDMKTLPDNRIIPALEAPLSSLSGFYEGEYITNYKGQEIWISMNTNPLVNTNGEVTGAVGIVKDITSRINQQKDIEHKASHDPLTNVYNRISLLQEINKEIIRYKRHGIIFALLFLDLDHFKNINDSLGHNLGDKILIQTAIRLKDSIREEDTVARIGGDEFIILLPDLSIEEKRATIKSELVAQKIQKFIEKHYNLDGYKLKISSSIGIALINDDVKDAEDLIKRSDIAMYEAKKEGRNTTRFYQEHMEQKARRYLEIENELRNALANHELEIYYQPIIELKTSKIIGAEALLRWNNKKLGKISPDEFIPIAEESGLIFSIGKWVLYNAVEQFKSWQSDLKDVVTLKKISVNVSVNQFNNPDFLKHVQDTIDHTHIDPNSIELELTESILIKNINEITIKMQKLRDMGVNLSIDDFGTGYSSLSYIKKLPFTTLKIDKSFTQDIQNDADDKELINAIVNIAENFDLETIAEGVETQEQYNFINDRNTTYIQGYYCAKPLDKKAFKDLILGSHGMCEKLLEH